MTIAPEDRHKLVTHRSPREISEALVAELLNLDRLLEPSYGIDSLGIAAGAVAGRHRLDPVEYVPKLIELVDRSISR